MAEWIVHRHLNLQYMGSNPPTSVTSIGLSCRVPPLRLIPCLAGLTNWTKVMLSDHIIKVHHVFRHSLRRLHQVMATNNGTGLLLNCSIEGPCSPTGVTEAFYPGSILSLYRGTMFSNQCHRGVLSRFDPVAL